MRRRTNGLRIPAGMADFAHNLVLLCGEQSRQLAKSGNLARLPTKSGHFVAVLAPTLSFEKEVTRGKVVLLTVARLCPAGVIRLIYFGQAVLVTLASEALRSSTTTLRMLRYRRGDETAGSACGCESDSRFPTNQMIAHGVPLCRGLPCSAQALKPSKSVVL